MATFAPISYTYVPTAPRSKSVATRPKPTSKQPSTLEKLQRSKLSRAALDGPQLPATAATDSNEGYRPEIQAETGTFYSGSDNDDYDFPTVEEILYTTLQKKGCTTEDPNPEITVREVEEVALEERRGPIGHSRSTSGDDSGGSLDDPIFLLGDDDSSAENVVLDVGLFSSPETTVDSTPPSSLDGWHDIDDFPETAPRLGLAEQEASTSDPMRPYNPSLCLSSESMHDRIGVEGLDTQRAIGQEDHLHASRSVADEHEHGLVRLAVDIDTFDKEKRQQQAVEAEDEDNDEDDGQPQQEVNGVAAELIAESVCGAHLSGKEDGSPRPAERQRLLTRDLSPEPSHDKARSDSDGDSDDELDRKADSDSDDGRPRPAKQKRPPSSYDGPMPKKRKHHLQQRSARQRRPCFKSHIPHPKSHSPLKQSSRVAAVPNRESRLSSPAPSAPQVTDTEISSDYCDLGGSSIDILPTLVEVKFRPHSPHCCFFTAVIRDGCDGRGVSFGQLARLIESIGHAGKIDDFTIKPIEQHSFLLTGFSRYTSSYPSSSGTTVAIAAEAGRKYVEATRTQRQHSTAVDTEALSLQESKPSISDDDGLSDSDPESSSDDDGCWGGNAQGCSSTRMNIPWEAVDEQRLLAYKKEKKPWDWIFGKFPGRTRPAIRTRWNMVRPRVE